MCGILFTYNFVSDDTNFLSALKLINYRGPDSTGNHYIGKNWKIGHNRLKIIDLNDRSNQPFWSIDKKWCVAYNGEVYNFKELKKKYDLSLRTESDTEVLLELFIKIGPSIFKEFIGMFSLVVIDNKSGSFIVARDRLGIKPLYYWNQGDSYVFCSELAPILSLTGSNEIDEIGVRQYLKLRTFFRGHTLYKRIKCFPAGNYMLNGQIHCYWDLKSEAKEAPTATELESLLRSAIDFRMISDVPVGTFLSGGLDSTLITALAKPQHTWSVGMSQTNEFYWSKFAASEYNTEHHEVIVSNNKFKPIAVEAINKRKEPLSVPNEVLLYALSSKAKPYNSVLLSGEGADELFAGYDRIFRWAANSKSFDIVTFSKLYSYGSHDDIEIVHYCLEPFIRENDPWTTVSMFFQIAHLHGLLRRLDSATMLHGIEARVPFVDHRLVEIMAGVSLQGRWNNQNNPKGLLKKVAENYVPKAIINREKIGFPVDLKLFFSEELGLSPMDSWLHFNLSCLDVDFIEIMKKHNISKNSVA